MCTSELGDEKASSLEMNYDTNQRWGVVGGGCREMKQRNWLVLSAERARAGAAEYVKNAAEWWGSPAVWGLILMDPVLLSKVPLAPVSDWALWATSAVTETATRPLHCWYSTKERCVTWKRDGAMWWYHLHTQQAFIKSPWIRKIVLNVCHRIFSLHGLELWKLEF